MITRKPIVAAALACLALLTARESEARRVGVPTPPADSAKPATNDDKKTQDGGPSRTANPADATPTVDELTRKRNEELARVRKRIEDDAKMRKADEDLKRQEDAQKAAEAQRKLQAQEAQKRAAAERAREAKRLERERREQCVVKPVMSDEDIEKCRASRGG